MAVCFSLLGFVNLNSKDENKLKISKQYFEKSAYVFDELRINSKNIANLKVIDFSQEYLTICLNVALAFSQYYIYQLTPKLCHNCHHRLNLICLMLA